MHRIAEDQMQQHTQAVAEGVSQLYTPERADQIISELAQWSDERQLQRHAGNCLLALASRPADDTQGGAPDLMTRLATNDVNGAELARLWQVSLLAIDPSCRAWGIFGEWLRQADSDETLRKSIGALVNELASVPTMRRRMQFHLVRLTEFQNGLPGWLESAMREW